MMIHHQLLLQKPILLLQHIIVTSKRVLLSGFALMFHVMTGQEKCAARLQIAQSSVQRGLTNGNYYAYAKAMDTINNILGEIQKNDI